MRITDISRRNFITNFSISKEAFIAQFEKKIDNKKSGFFTFNKTNLDSFKGAIESKYFKVVKFYSFGHHQHCTIVGKGVFSESNDSLSIDTTLSVNSFFSNRNTIFYILFTFIFLFIGAYIMFMFLAFSMRPDNNLALNIGGFLLLSSFFYFISWNTKKRGMEKMKQELIQEFELIELRSTSKTA